MLVVELIHRVDRREEVAVAIELALGAFHVVAGVGDEFHLIELISQSGIDIEFAYGDGGGEITGSQGVVSLVVVAHHQILEDVKTIAAEVLLVGEKFGHVHTAESVGQVVVLRVPGVEELACLVFTGAIFAVGTNLERWLKRTEVEVVLLVDICRHDMLVEFGELAVDVVAAGELDDVVVLVVDGVALAVGHTSVGIGVACAPLQMVVGEGVLTGELGVVCDTAAIVVFSTNLIV